MSNLIKENLKEKILLESQKRNDDLDKIQLEQIAKDIAVGTIRYEMIKPDLDKIITFDLNNSLKLEGDTCSYIQYSYARASRILEKSEGSVSQSNYCTYNDEELFYSYRRDKTDKRALTLLWRKDV